MNKKKKNNNNNNKTHSGWKTKKAPEPSGSLQGVSPTCPSGGAATLELVEGQQVAAAAVAAGVVGEAGGVLGPLAVLPREAQGAGADGGARHLQPGGGRRAAVAPVEAGVRAAGVRVLAVVPQVTRGTPAHTHTHTHR